jgi:DNA polymerase II
MCDGEKTMLNIFCQLIKELNIDVITGWYSHGYDVPYIMKRMQKLFGNYNMISPTGNAWLGNKRPQDDYYKLRISGLDSIDLMEVVKSLNYNLQNNKLDTAAE